MLEKDHIVKELCP